MEELLDKYFDIKLQYDLYKINVKYRIKKILIKIETGEIKIEEAKKYLEEMIEEGE